jgi:5'-nucleotidase / UDP-sugar diphosphatase
MPSRWLLQATLAGALSCSCASDWPREGRGSVSLALLHTSDLHSRVWPFRARVSELEAELGFGSAGTLSELGGFARLGAAVERERERGAALWLDSGDALEGAAVFKRFRGRVELELLSSLGLDAMALGNHELSLSARELGQVLARHARFPVLSANHLPEPRSELSGLFEPSLLLTASGVRVGIIGVSNPASPPDLQQRPNAWRLEPVDAAAATQLALELLAAQAELLIVLSHLGLDGDRRLVAGTRGIDLVLGGHQHIVTAEPEWQLDATGRAVPIVHGGAYGKALTRLELELEQGGAVRGLELAALRLERLPLVPGAAESAAALALLEPYWPAPEAPLAYLLEPLRRSSALGADCSLGNLVADVLREAAGADVALLNTSALRADLEAGPLLREELELALPFDEPWLRVSTEARELRRGLERAAARSAAAGCVSPLQVSGLKLTIACSACARGECVGLQRPTPWGDLPLRDDELLSLVLPAYLARPGSDFASLAGGEPESRAASDVLASYLARLPWGSEAAAAACTAALVSLSPSRCRFVFGPRCPPSPSEAQAVCRRLPRVSGRSDGRIQMAP